jgi:hypothetical protein
VNNSRLNPRLFRSCSTDNLKPFYRHRSSNTPSALNWLLTILPHWQPPSDVKRGGFFIFLSLLHELLYVYSFALCNSFHPPFPRITNINLEELPLHQPASHHCGEPHDKISFLKEGTVRPSEIELQKELSYNDRNKAAFSRLEELASVLVRAVA